MHAVDATDRLSLWAGGRLGRLADVDRPRAPAASPGVSAPPEGGTSAWVGYTDYATPPSVLRWDAGAPTALTELGAGRRRRARCPALTVVETHATSADGTPVHLFVLSGTGAPDVPRPTVLYGYGGFNVSLTPAYTAQALAWVAAGGVWAVANLRGGSEHGEEWHRAGMRERKQNVFDDFAAAGEHLVAQGWTTHEQLGVYGRLERRPAGRRHADPAARPRRPPSSAARRCWTWSATSGSASGRTWNDEYGTAEDPTELGWLLGYSPYHAVREGTAYPAVLFTTFESDTRVDPLHGRKLAAALQHATTAERPVVLRRETSVGHGARAVSRTVGLAADQLAFLAEHTGLAPR